MISPQVPLVRLAAVQLPGCSGHRETDVACAVERVRSSARQGVDLILLPELATLPYFCAEPAGAYRDRAETVPGPLTERFAALARELDVAIALPLFEHDAIAGTWHNSVVLLARDGTVVPAVDRSGSRRAVSRKLHLPVGDDPAPGFDETAHFTPGDGLGVHDLDGLRVGVLVCYDRRFPECWRELRALGAQIVLVPMAGDGGDGGDFVIAELRTHARENGLIVVAASKVGAEIVGGQRVGNVGESLVVGSDGTVLQSRHDADGPGTVIATVDISEQMAVRRHLQYFDHRRLDLFGGPTPVPSPTLELS